MAARYVIKNKKGYFLNRMPTEFTNTLDWRLSAKWHDPDVTGTILLLTTPMVDIATEGLKLIKEEFEITIIQLP